MLPSVVARLFLLLFFKPVWASIAKWTERRGSPALARFKWRASLFVSVETTPGSHAAVTAGPHLHFQNFDCGCFAEQRLSLSRAEPETSLETGLIAVFVLHVSRFANSLFVPHAFCLSHLRARQLYRRLCQSGFIFFQACFSNFFFLFFFSPVFGFYNFSIDKAKQSR